VLDLVQAKNESVYRSAIQQLQGKLSGYIQDLTNDLKIIVAQMENLLEFEEDYNQSETEFRKLTNRLKTICNNFEATIKKNEQLKFLRNGVYCVIVGRPNVGKSSLFNRLSEMEKAIVTEIPGTTRDSLEQTITINGIFFHLIDTAGLKVISQPKGVRKIEALGIEKSKNWLEVADFVLAVFDNSSRVKKEDQLVYNATKTKPHLFVLNKIDLKPKFNHKIFNHETVYSISAKYNKGIGRLKTAITNFYKRRLPTSSNNYLYLNTRHIDTLNRVAGLLKQSEQEKYLDVSIMNLRNALDVLGTITSAVTNEQILDTIFMQFCIGK
jgi:tRNA modification GTPase